MTIKDTAINIGVLLAVFFAGWFINGKRTDQQWRDKIGNSNVVIQSFDRYIDAPVPGKPVPIPGEPTKDTTGIAAALDSLHGVYKDSLAVQRSLAQSFSGTYSDTTMYLKYTADPVRKMIILDSLWIRPVRCDSTVVTKVVIQPVPQGATWQTAACVSIGAAAGASMADETGAAIGAVAGLGLDWLIEKIF